MAVKVMHMDLAQHQCTIIQMLQQFWLEGRLCDIVLKSSDGTRHPAHANVLCAASQFFQTMLCGPFAEADQVKKGEPVEIAASEPVVSALLDYIYGKQPELKNVDDAMELLRLADAYDLPHLVAAIEAGLCSMLDQAPVVTALTILNHSQGLHDLKAACEGNIALNFEACLEEPAFLDLSEDQLGSVLKREDLKVSREDIVLQGIFKWFNSAKGMHAVVLTLLLQNLQAIFSVNLDRIHQFALSLGPEGDELQRLVHEALQARKNRAVAETSEFRPRRRCLQYCSAYLGASSEVLGQELLPDGPDFYWSFESFCWHEDGFYCASAARIYRWKPGKGNPQVVAGSGARVVGVNDLGKTNRVCVSPDGRLIVADRDKQRLVSFHNGFGQVLATDIEGLRDVCCSPNGVVYVLNQYGQAVQKLVSHKMQLVINSKHLPAHETFRAYNVFVTREEVVYISDFRRKRVVRVRPGNPDPLVDVVGDVVDSQSCNLGRLFVTEDGRIYVADYGQRKVLALHPGDETWKEVLQFPHLLHPLDVMVHDRLLYVSAGKRGRIYKYDLPPALDLDTLMKID